MSEKGYYYLKLKENFFDSDEMKILESMENGYLYSNILLKLYLKALKNNGKLTFNEYIPYDIRMLSTIVGHNIDIVDKAIKIFQSMHLIEILDNGTIYMLDMQKMIGSISSEGVRKAEYREKILLEKNGTSVGQCPNIISNYNSISNSISNSNNIELKNKVKKKKDFIPPTFDEVKEYAKSRNREDLAKIFYDYYTADKDKQWVDSRGNKVSNWKCKFITWENKNKKDEPINKSNNSSLKKPVERSYSEEELNTLFDDPFKIKI